MAELTDAEWNESYKRSRVRAAARAGFAVADDDLDVTPEDREAGARSRAQYGTPAPKCGQASA